MILILKNTLTLFSALVSKIKADGLVNSFFQPCIQV
jgi:hypothetical protein